MTDLTDRSDPALLLTLQSQLTKKIHRKVYHAISATNPANSASGKIVLITGGGSGIGAAAARVWADAGAEAVVICGRRTNMLEKTARSIDQAKTRLLCIGADLTVEKDTEDMYAKIKAAFGRHPDGVIANAGWVSEQKLLSEESVSTWWKVYEINVLGLHNTVASFIRSQPDPKHPTGTVININTGIAGKVVPGVSAYATSKLAAHRYMEYVHAEFPQIRTFTLLPGVVMTTLIGERYAFFAKDEAELTGSTALYLARDTANYLRGSLCSVNWDVEELEAHKDEISDNKILQIKWIAALPSGGGSGF